MSLEGQWETWTVCPACSLLCDDVIARGQANGEIRVEGACLVGQNWYASRTTREELLCYEQGVPVTFESAILAASRKLRATHSPLVCGISPWSLEAQQMAAHFVHRVGGFMAADWCEAIDGDDEVLKSIGQVTASLGHVNRMADLVVCWFVDPQRTHPRLFERHCQKAQRIIVIGEDRDLAMDHLDPRVERWSMPRSEAAHALNLLDAACKKTWTTVIGSSEVGDAPWLRLLCALRCASFSAWFVAGDGGDHSAGAQANKSDEMTALYKLVRQLNDVSRSILISLPMSCHRAGAEQILRWSCGAAEPTATTAGGHAHSIQSGDPWQLLESRACDVVLTGLDPWQWAEPGRRSLLTAVPWIYLYEEYGAGVREAAVAIPVAQVGWDCCGEYCRLDYVTHFVPKLVSTHRRDPVEVLKRILPSIEGS